MVLLAALWVNRSYPGLSLAFLGVLSNTLVIVANDGFMPIWQPALSASGLDRRQTSTGRSTSSSTPGSQDFLGRLLILGDVIPAPVPIIRNVYSLGDLFLGLGLAFFLFAGVVRVPTADEEQEDAELRRRLAAQRAGGGNPSGLTPGLQRTAELQRPTVLGAGRQRLAAPGATAADSTSATQTAPGAPAFPIPGISPDVLARLRRHPYVRLALNGSFGALWAGQLISLFGDRIHLVAIGAIVFVVTGSPIAVAFVFVFATLPNLLFGPIAGTLVDRWDHREVLVVSDILRAAIVLIMPIAASLNIFLVYPLAFLLTTISIFFRPARVAILPRLVREDELLAANSALWVGETMADVVGFALAGLFVALVAEAVSIAFWLDGATYLASALLLSTLIPRPMPREEAPATAGEPAPAGFRAELVAGWRFLRNDRVLLANTLQAVVAQLTIGVLIGQTLVFAERVFGPQGFDWEAVYGFIEASQGAGNLVGGFVIGLIGARLSKGHMIIAGYTVLGLLTTLMALSGNLGAVLAIAFGIGIANMVFIIPSQTLFQERTPVHLLGRVISFRFSLVGGAMALSIGVGGVLAETIGVTTVIAAFGLVTAAAGIAGWFVPAVREA